MNLIDIDTLEWIQARCSNGKTYVLIDAKSPYDLPRVDANEKIRQLESNYNQVSKALCGKENATVEEILQAVDQMKEETDE